MTSSSATTAVAVNQVVSIHYQLTNAEGEVLDASTPDMPLVYLAGAGNIIRGLERALMGKTIGEKFDITVSPAEAYGDRDENLVQTVPKTAFEGVDSISEGMQFHAAGDSGEVMVTVTAVTDDKVTVDANHPLAGQDLTFAVEVVAIRAANDVELSQGRPHPAG